MRISRFAWRPTFLLCSDRNRSATGSKIILNHSLSLSPSNQDFPKRALRTLVRNRTPLNRQLFRGPYWQYCRWNSGLSASATRSIFPDRVFRADPWKMIVSGSSFRNEPFSAFPAGFPRDKVSFTSEGRLSSRLSPSRPNSPSVFALLIGKLTSAEERNRATRRDRSILPQKRVLPSRLSIPYQFFTSFEQNESRFTRCQVEAKRTDSAPALPPKCWRETRQKRSFSENWFAQKYKRWNIYIIHNFANVRYINRLKRNINMQLCTWRYQSGEWE